MNGYLVRHQASLWLGLFMLASLVIAVAERYAPRRKPTGPAARRWSDNVALAFLTQLMLLCIYRAGAVLFAFAAGSNPHGLLNNGVLPFGVSCVLTIALLDLLRYGLHYLLHAVPMLWRVHRVHHSDRDMDLTTGLRSHPLEVLLTQGIYLGVIALLTPPVIAVAILELVSFVPELFAHANLAIPDWIDRRLRRFLITPDMHRVHHSEIFAEQNANF